MSNERAHSEQGKDKPVAGGGGTSHGGVGAGSAARAGSAGSVASSESSQTTVSGSEARGPGGGRSGGTRPGGGEGGSPESTGKWKQARSQQASHRPNTIVSKAPRGARGQAQKGHWGPDEVVFSQISDEARPWAREHRDVGKALHPIHDGCAQGCRIAHGAA